MSKVVEIDCCMDCPHTSDNDYYGAFSCDLMDGKYLCNCLGEDFGIHPDCPLPDAEDKE